MITKDERQKEEIINTPHKSKEDKEYCSPKYSITIDYLAEHYKHTYHQYWYIEHVDGRYIRKVKSKKEGQDLVYRCNCQGIWKVKNHYENEEVLIKRMRKNVEQKQFTHKPLDFAEQRKAVEVKRSLDTIRGMHHELDKREKERSKENLRRKLEKGEPLGEITYEKKEVIQEQQEKQARAKLIQELMG